MIAYATYMTPPKSVMPVCCLEQSALSSSSLSPLFSHRLLSLLILHALILHRCSLAVASPTW